MEQVVKINQWLARKQGLPRIAVITCDRETDKAYHVTSGVGAVDAYKEHVYCIHCARELTHPISRYVGIGPICCQRSGIPWMIPDDTNENSELIAALKEVVKLKTTFTDMWIPKSQLQTLKVLEDWKQEEIEKREEEKKESRRIEIHGNAFKVTFDFDRSIVDAIKRLKYNERAWNPADKCWYVKQTAALDLARLAQKFQFNVSEEAAAILTPKVEDYELKAREEREKALEEARSMLDSLNLRLDLMPFQMENVAYALQKKDVLIADEMGLGKTPSALAVIEAANAYPALVVAPKNVVLKWRSEVRKWLYDREPCVLTHEVKQAHIFVINYDQLKKFKTVLSALPWKSVVLDESHYIKTKDAQRSREAKEIIKRAREEGTLEYTLLLSGTPLKNRPVELVNQLEALGKLQDFGGFQGFAWRYCNPKNNGWGYDFSGAANLEELNSRLRSICMTQHSKKEVLPDLPDIQSSEIPMELENLAFYKEAEADIISWLAENVSRLKAESAARAEALVRLNTLRHLVGEQKISSMREWINDFLESSDEKLIVFGWHKAVLQELSKEYDADLIDGSVSGAQRERMTERFQEDTSTRILFLNIKAGGEGINLTAATNVVFLELPWTWADIDQAIARAYGRLSDAHGVNAWFLLADDTIDMAMWAMVNKKKDIVEATTSGNGNEASAMMEVIRYLTGKEA